MRGRILFDGGRRPAFRLADGRFADPDPRDGDAYHLVVRSLAKPVGCIRLVPLMGTDCCATETLLGTNRFEALLAERGTLRTHCCEASRWMVVAEYRRSGLAIRLVAGAYAISRRLGLDTIVATVGIRDGQAGILRRIGGQYGSGLAPLRSSLFDDDLAFMCFDVKRRAHRWHC